MIVISPSSASYAVINVVKSGATLPTPIDVSNPYVDNYNSSWINYATKNDDTTLIQSITEFKKLADEGITFKIDSPTEITVVGINKQLVGETAAKIQKLRKSDPYKGKGLHLEGARIRRKQGKTGKK